MLDFIPHPTTIILAVALVIVVAPPLATGLICGWRIDGLPMRRGALLGTVVGVVVFVLFLATPLVNLFAISHLVVAAVSVMATWLLCYWSYRRGLFEARGSSG